MAKIDLDSEIKKTQDLLGKFVKKPALTEKLLKKPPFRFLHDVITAIIRDTGHFKNIYTREELNSENIKDRDGKIAFLQKIIDVVKSVANEPPLTVKPSKIVAGHEPEQTNDLLQRIAFIISNELNTSPVANGDVPKAKLKKDESPTKPKARKSSDPKVKVPKTSSKDSEEPKKSRTKILPKGSSKETSPDKKPKRIEKQKTIKNLEPEEINSAESVKLTSVAQDSSTVPQENTAGRKSEDRKSSSGGSRKSSAEKKVTSEDRKSSGKRRSAERKLSIPEESSQSQETQRNESNKKTVDERKPSGKTKSLERKQSIPEESHVIPEVSKNEKPEDVRSVNSSAEAKETPLKPEYIAEDKPKISSEPEKKSLDQRPPPLARQNSILSRPRTSLRPPSARPPSARPGAPRRRDKSIEIILQPNEQTTIGGINVKVESFNSELEDDGENLIVIENSNIEEDVLGTKLVDQAIIDDEEQQKGHLVQQILETQKELVQGDKNDIEKTLKERRNRQTSATQIDSLRGLIQTLTKAVNPTGKLLDYIPEDIDSMQLELNMWRDTYTQAAAELKREKSLTESATEPLKNQLAQLDQQIKEYKEMIENSRAKILQNSDKIRSLLIEG